MASWINPAMARMHQNNASDVKRASSVSFRMGKKDVALPVYEADDGSVLPFVEIDDFHCLSPASSHSHSPKDIAPVIEASRSQPKSIGANNKAPRQQRSVSA